MRSKTTLWNGAAERGGVNLANLNIAPAKPSEFQEGELVDPNKPDGPRFFVTKLPDGLRRVPAMTPLDITLAKRDLDKAGLRVGQFSQPDNIDAE